MFSRVIASIRATALTVVVLAVGHLSAAPMEPAPAVMRVTLPADARLTIDGYATQSSSTERVFVSPPLAAEKSFHYTLKAEFIRAGKTIIFEQDATVRAGRETLVSLDVPAEAHRSYYSAPQAPAAARATPYRFPFTRSEDLAPRGDRSFSPGFRPTHWGSDARDPFHPGSEW